jgi:hypothetical protein
LTTTPPAAFANGVNLELLRLEKLIYEFNEDFTKSRMDIYKRDCRKDKYPVTDYEKNVFKKLLSG